MSTSNRRYIVEYTERGSIAPRQEVIFAQNSECAKTIFKKRAPSGSSVSRVYES
jgi:hypothetical protein